MGLLSWLTHANKREASGEAHEAISFTAHEEEFEGLNMKLAIEAHINWKEKLEKALKGESDADALEVGQVASDDRCILGQWLHHEAKQRFSHLPEYQELIKSHADFHLMAGDILCDVHDGRHQVAAEKLRRDFRQKSDRVQLHLVRLYAKARA